MRTRASQVRSDLAILQAGLTFRAAAALTLKRDSMKTFFLLFLPLAGLAADPALTIYNQNFAAIWRNELEG
jgi:hypothetical protein